MSKYQLEKFLYQNLAKPVLFRVDAELVHNCASIIGENIENNSWLVSSIFSYPNQNLSKKVLGVEFPNPVGLAAGFDYNGHLAKIMTQIGFGFSTIGTVTAQPYPGNKPPRLKRLPKSGALLVNKGFKSDGAIAVAYRLDNKELAKETIGISIGSSNLPAINSISKAIDDYLFTSHIFREKPYVKYFELNISCPNTAMTQSFLQPKNFHQLTSAVASLGLKQPIFIKMPNEIDFEKSDQLIGIALSAGIRGFIFSNLVKNRANPALNRQETHLIKNLRGNISGKPTAKNAKNLLVHTRKKFRSSVALISTGGIFSPTEAQQRLNLGADLVQLITGMIYEGPQLAGEINAYLAASLG